MMGNLTARILSAVVLVPILLVLVFFSGFWIFFSAVVLLSALCGFELGSFTLGPDFQRYRYLLAFTSALCTAGMGLFNIYPAAVILGLFLSVFLSFLFFIASRAEPQKSSTAFSFSLSGAIYCGALTGFIALIFSNSKNGNYWVFTLLLATFVADTFAYAFGKTLGRHKLSRHLSPNKTWEGSIGSFLGTLLSVATCKYFFLDLSWLEVGLLSLVLNVACQLGDLSESFLKRGFGVKDSGKIIPGHGGILDRVDALIFGAPVLFFFSVLR
jgi:phosphatidate cytidylyltransferase